jgi:hypothetical protein
VKLILPYICIFTIVSTLRFFGNDFMSKLRVSALSYVRYCLQPPIYVRYCLQPPNCFRYCLQPPIYVRYCLQPPIYVRYCLQPPIYVRYYLQPPIYVRYCLQPPILIRPQCLFFHFVKRFTFKSVRNKRQRTHSLLVSCLSINQVNVQCQCVIL